MIKTSIAPLLFEGDYASNDGDALPLGKVFSWLRERWLEQDEERTSVALAEHLGVSPQQITNWSHPERAGGGAPWWGVLRLCDELRVALVVEAGRVYMVPMREAS